MDPLQQRIQQLQSLGYTPEEIQASLNRKLSSIQQTQQPQEGFVSKLISGILQPFGTTGNTLMAGAYEAQRLPRAWLANTALGKKLMTEKTRNELMSKDNPYVSHQQMTPDLIRKQLGASAQLASYGIPVGGATSAFGKTLATSAIKGGALAGGLYGFGGGLQEENVTPESVLMGTGLGAVTGGATAGLLSKLLKAPASVENAGRIGRAKVRGIQRTGGTGALKEMSASEALSGLGFKGSPGAQRTQAAKLEVELGKQVEDMVGSTGGKQSAEKVLGSIRKLVDADTMSEFVPGDKTYETAYTRIISGLEKKAQSGELTMKQLYAFKKALNKSLTTTYIKLDKGKTLTPSETARLAIRDAADQIISKEVPGSKPLLLQMKTIEETSTDLARQAKNPFGRGGVIAALLSLIRPTGQAAVDLTSRGAIKAGQLGAPVQKATTSVIPQVGELVPAIGARVAPAAIESGEKQQLSPQARQIQAALDTMSLQQQTTQPMEQPTQTAAMAGMPTQEQFQQAMLLDLMQGGKNISKIKAVMDAVYPSGGTGKLSVTASQRLDLAKAGLRGLDKAQELYNADNSLLTKQLLPGKFASREFDSALFSAMEALLRARSGAAVPEAEVRRYMTRLGPSFGDSSEVVAYKMQQLRQMLEDMKSSALYSTGDTTINNSTFLSE